MPRDVIMAFTDGACSGNPGPGGWGAVLVFPDDHVRELGGPDHQTTNNRMEMQAALSVISDPATAKEPIKILTDSSYLIQGITEWIKGWKRRDWQTSTGDPVANQDLWQDLDAAIAARSKDAKVSWQHVRGHHGVPGNERADRIAVAYSQGEAPELFHGQRGDYGIDVLNLSAAAKAASGGSSKKKGKAYSYVSLIDGTPMVHDTWAQCEARVKGKSGAKFKKTQSLDDERNIFSSWGVAPPR